MFDSVIPIELYAEAAAHSTDELRAAAELMIEYSVQTAHPRFLNQNFAGPDPVAVAGDWLGAALNTTNATYEAAPVFTLMEAALLRKLGRLAQEGGPERSGHGSNRIDIDFCPLPVDFRAADTQFSPVLFVGNNRNGHS